ncbi:RNA-binding domain-containing protein [Ralstonia pseudosolanacearum]|uniref:RNA-binding domain-containing protein n=1 Tax=Ralstonia pseudosolanacearum TaxID=1310165 RepID=UPI0006760E10|nr:RNA-binding domain-containing protein [Ralstonia pseudosolanacearum]MDO3558662.1 ATP-binding protein [Ralstonia pseudosolanacearum]MDO3575116.1 ATP-binding protein [Ralstonia pseudosolanacearum]MDO3585000.1 ATP-binding protein [Ralstonia pseudosolanacearum]
MIDTTDLVRELLYQVRLGEDSAYEFKSITVKGRKIDQPGRDSIADELAAFANANGGIVVFGVADKTRAVEGIAREDLDTVDLWLANIASHAIDPPLPIETRLLEIPNQQGELKPVVWVRVSKSVFVHKSPHGYFHRVGSSKREMSPELLARIFQQRSMVRLIRFDEQLVPQTTRDAISPELKARFLRGDLPEVTQLQKLYLIGEDESGELRLSVSGVLLLTARPADYLSTAYIQCVAYSGNERNAEYQVDAQDCDGPVDEQIRHAFNFVKRNMRVEAVKRPGRIDIPQYDLAAVFEAIVNAVAHRDYSMHGARIRLHLFADRLELSTPGGLPNSLTVASMEANSITRNETLVNLLSRYYPADPVSKRQNLIERRGEGVPTILTASENLSLRRPLYEQIDHTELKLTIYAASREKNGLLAQFTSEE